jgi:hypothetical protein
MFMIIIRVEWYVIYFLKFIFNIIVLKNLKIFKIKNNFFISIFKLKNRRVQKYLILEWKIIYFFLEKKGEKITKIQF